jgi:chemotaxis response regulator CheB
LASHEQNPAMMVPAPGDDILDPENSADGRDASAQDSEHGGQPDEESTDTQRKVLQIVGIGASAGGLEALEALLGSLPPDARPAFVVAQHLSPDRRSLLVELMSRCTPLQVRQAVDGAALLPGTVSIGPPNHDIRVDRERLVVSDPEPRFGPSPSIDRLFDSIAEHWGECGVAVVLSGTGSDGARGLVAVRTAGGLTMAQTPHSARFAGMPTAAITLGGGRTGARARRHRPAPRRAVAPLRPGPCRRWPG